MPKSDSKKPSEVWKLLLLLIMAGTAVLVLPVSAANKPFVTIAAQGAGSYYLGEDVILAGMNSDTGSTYLYITGPTLPESGGKLTSPEQKTVNGNADTFTVVSTKTDKTWKYSWYTAGLVLDAGSYTVYAVSKPYFGDQLADTPYGTTSIIIKKPFITAALSPTPVVKGQPFHVTGTAEGNIPHVKVWIIGDNYVYTTITPVNIDNNFTFTADAALSEKLPAGQNYLFVQHPMQDNQFDIDISGDYVRNIKLNNGTNLFKITGTGSLQGSDAADALIAAFSSVEARDDTYTVIPFKVTGAGSSTAQPTGIPGDTTASTPYRTQNLPFLFIPVGGLLLVLGIVLWKRH